MDRGTNSFVGGPFFCDYGTGNRLLQKAHYIFYYGNEAIWLGCRKRLLNVSKNYVGFVAFALYQARDKAMFLKVLGSKYFLDILAYIIFKC